MSFFDQIQETTNIFSQLWFLITHGGWVVLVLLVLYMLYNLYIEEIQHQFLTMQEWVFLSIRIPKTNIQSTLAVEQIFTQMHALATTITFVHKYVEGKKQLWYSLELVSLGGQISFIIRAPKKVRQLVESSFYAHYPSAEITEVADYLENVEYDPETSELGLFGFELKLSDDVALPIKTYKEFEHPSAEEKIIDPLTSLFESLAAIQPYELYAVQILIRPVDDDDWKPKSEAKAKELIAGDKKKEEHFSLLAALWDIGQAVVSGSIALFSTGEEEEEKKKEESKQERTFMNLSDVEKERVNGVLRKASKPGYETKIRHLYLAPKEKFDGNRKSLPIGAYRTLGSANSNKFKPDTKRTWTDLNYKVSEDLERPYIESIVKARKRRFFKGFKNRSMWIGLQSFILNVEELATIYHLPLVSQEATSQPAVTSVETKKSQPPANLPIGEY